MPFHRRAGRHRPSASLARRPRVFLCRTRRACIHFAPALSAIWPWPVDVLTLRVFTAQIAVVGLHSLLVLKDNGLWRPLWLGQVLSLGIGAAQLVALVLNSTTYDWAAPLAVLLPLMFGEWVLTGLASLLIYRKL